MTREDYLMNKEIFDAWADGAEVEYRAVSGHTWLPAVDPLWHPGYKYRIKPFIPKQGDTILVGTDVATFQRVFVKMDCGKFRCIGQGMNDWSMDGNKLHTHAWSTAKPYIREEDSHR